MVREYRDFFEEVLSMEEGGLTEGNHERTEMKDSCDAVFYSLALKMADSFWGHVHSFVYCFRMDRFFFLSHVKFTNK
ncbi:hypothetical protein NC652_038444 [Populus alba x Populus x berolinensis]|nr:hypothetical protein NC652_038444 [Populus alba x Populus x berolinensis]